MSDYTNGSHDWTNPRTQAVARAALAKAGQSLSDRDDRSSLLEDRNALRRAITQTQARADAALTKGGEDGNKQFEAAMDEIAALGAIGERKQRLLNARDSVDAFGRNTEAKPLRNAEDFRAHYRNRSAGGEDYTIADFLRGVANMSAPPAVRNALSTGTDSAGGYTVPSILMPGILEALAPASSLLKAGAGIVPLEEGARSYTWAAVSAIPTAAWRNEAGAVAESDPAFRAVVASPKSLSFRFKISRELLADGRNLNAALYLAIGQAFAKEMDRAGLRGSGVAPEPLGIKGTSGVISVANGANGASLATTKYANFHTALQQILEANGPANMAAIMAPRSLVTLGGLVDSTGQPLEVPPLLRDVPMIATSQIPTNLTVGTSNDCSEIYLGDFSNVAFMLREAPSIQLLQELYAATGEIGFACHARVDVAVLRPGILSVVTGVRA